MQALQTPFRAPARGPAHARVLRRVVLWALLVVSIALAGSLTVIPVTDASAAVVCSSQAANGSSQTLRFRQEDGESEACITFTGNAGDVFRFRQARSEGGAYFRSVEVFAPDGSAECPPSGEVDITCTVSASGTHTIRLTQPTSPRFTNAFAIRRVGPRPSCQPFRVGTEATTGAIARPGELDCFAVDARAGETLRLRLADTGGTLEPEAEMIGPDGTTLCEARISYLRGTGYIQSCTATQTGTMAVIVASADARGNALPTYALSIQRPVRRPTGCVPIGFGDAPAQIALTKPAEVSCLRVWGQAGDVLRLRTADLSDPWDARTEFINPVGATCATITGTGSARCLLTTTGWTTVLVGAAPDSVVAGNTAVSLQRLNRPRNCTPLTDGGAPILSTPFVAAEMRCYTISVAADQFISVQYTQPLDVEGGRGYELIGPDGRVLAGPTSAPSLVVDAATAGTYTVLFGGRSDAPGEYKLRVRLG